MRAVMRCRAAALVAWLLLCGPAMAVGPAVVASPSVQIGGPIDTNTVLGRTESVRAADIWNALDHGVVGDGVTDDAPAIRGLFASGRYVVFPANHTYYLGSAAAPGYPASNSAAVLVSQLTNFHALAYGATFLTASAISLSQAVLFDRDTHWTWDGGTFIGNRSGLTASQENVGIGLFNNVDFRVSGARFAGYGGIGAAFAGDWNVNGTIQDVQMDGVGIGFDTAYSQNLLVSRVRATGADTNGNAGSGQVGNKFYSNIYDVPNAGQNLTGYSFADTNGVTIDDCDFSNFQTGIAIASGSHYRMSRNNSHDNPGLNSAKGLGYYIYYNNGGTATSAGHPVSDVAIDGGLIVNNGSAVAGYGVLVDVSAITNTDVIDGVMIQGVLFDNNATTAIGALGTAVANLTIGTNAYKGTVQTTTINAAALAIARSAAIDASGSMTLRGIGSGTDLGLSMITAGGANWKASAASGNGNWYLYDAVHGSFPFTVGYGALNGAINITTTGVRLTGATQIAKLSAAPAAPGAGYVTLFALVGTNAGTCKVQAIAGTSTTPVTIVDNVGSGC